MGPARMETAVGASDEVSASWERSARLYRVDRTSSTAPNILTLKELRERREPLERLIGAATGELDHLYALVRDAGYALLFCDARGTAIDHRGNEADASRFKYWGTWLGGVWSEALEGTNGIGTCIAEERPVTVHRTQHFRARHGDLSCSGAPIFGADGKLMAVLDVSAVDPELSEHAHALTGALTIAAAHAIEERYFRETFGREWVVALAAAGEPDRGVLLALDESHRILGASRAARTSLALDDDRLRAGAGLWTLFHPNVALLQRSDGSDIPGQLTRRGSEEVWIALATPPQSVREGPAGLALRSRPRVELLKGLRAVAPVPLLHGGLAPKAVREVRKYVEAHLNESVDLKALAEIAGLSVFHFAREFKRSTGIAPHQYLLTQRLERARALLAGSDLSLAEIALAAGFSDQSHMARHFRQSFGATPRQLRRSQE